MTENCYNCCCEGTLENPVTAITSTLVWQDRLGAWKARWGINRDEYTVAPGLYALGAPDATSPVLVSANYKLSFDTLRSALPGRSAWILVLDTKGINVWCAAGKGTFGTEELIRQITQTRLTSVVNSRRIIVPQLGAPGVAAHEVEKATDFRVVYGPVRAADLPAFLDAGCKATPRMRQVEFTFKDRVVLIPMELVQGARYLFPVAVLAALLSGFRSATYTADHVASGAPPIVITLLLAWLSGAVLGPALLPWLPGRSFSVKGLMAGILGLVLWPAACMPLHVEPLDVTMAVLLIPPIASFLTLLFTGASTYTSLSGVRKEMRAAIPVQLALACLGTGLWITARFI